MSEEPKTYKCPECGMEGDFEIGPLNSFRRRHTLNRTYGFIECHNKNPRKLSWKDFIIPALILIGLIALYKENVIHVILSFFSPQG